VGYQFANLAKN